MVLQSAWRQSFGFLGSKAVVVEPVACQLSSDAGLLPIREFDEAIGFTQQFADALADPRHQTFTRHSFTEMTRSRVYGILADYEDQNDHDVLRSDPVFKLIAGRSPDANDLASQPTLSRFENAISVRSLFALCDVMIDQFIASFDTPPARLTFDIDTYDDPAHGAQQLVLFHGYYNQYQYQPRVITCADNDQVVMACLLYGSAHPALGAEEDLEYLAGRLRAVWPDIDIELRADSGFGVPRMFDACERLRIWYSIGLKMNAVLQRESQACLDEALAAYEAGGGTQRQFTSFAYQAGSWAQPRHTVVKCEVNAQGTNRRAIATNRRGAEILPGATYDEYANRGESENRNKELKRGLAGDRLSDHRYMANLFRLYLHSAAHNLLVRLRRAIANPPAASPLVEIPTEALSGRDRKRYETHRREQDPLGEGHPCTWRSRLIKVAAQVVVTTRCIRVKLSGCWPFLDFYRDVSAAIQSLRLTPPSPD